MILFPAFLHAGAKAEEPEPEEVNNEWTLCITAFDVSAIPVSSRIMGDILARDVANALAFADSRYRGGEETAFYEDHAWARARSAAARALAAKRNERDLLLYQGNTIWKYRKDLRTKEEEIAKLEDALKKIDEEKPLVNPEPLFQFSDSNKGGAWPAPPSGGGEYRFCIAQKADAFITGTLSEFHGRILVSLKMYTLYTRSYSYEDMVAFSSEDIQEALDELSGRVFAKILGREPAVLAVYAQPEEAVVLIDGVFAGHGDTGLRDISPGQAEIEVSGGEYAPERFSIELNAGEIAELFINLSLLSLEVFTVEAPESPGSSVYLGGLYLGEVPLDVEIPRGESAYITVETPSGETGSALIRDGRIIRGSAEFSGNGGNVLVYETFPPIDPAEKRVRTAKDKFYGSWGRFWIALPVSLLTIGITNNVINANNNPYGSGSQELYDKALTAYYAQGAAYGLLALAAGELVYRIVRYLYVSRSDADPLARFPQEIEKQGADFQSADFQSADFQSADFQSADFQSADFQAADFQAADFQPDDFQSDESSGDAESAGPEEG